MKQNNLLRSVLFNWPIKVLSLVFAISFFLVVRYATLDSREVELPLHVINPKNFIASSALPNTILVKISGEDREIHLIDPSEILVSVDFSFVRQEGVASAPVVLDYGTTPYKTNITFAAEPEFLRVYFSPSPDTDASSQNAQDVSPIVL
jgi:hypothetical protein